jgi:hypothetical protein
MFFAMIRRIVGALTVVATASLSFAQVPSFDISCEGTQSTGGGARLYQYEVRNISPAPVMLTDLRIGTDDLTLLNYSNILNPPGFNFLLGQDTVLWTSTVKTAHGAIIPNGQWVRPTAGLIRWNNPQGLVMPPGATAVFGFDHPFPAEDVEWVANAVGGPIGIGVPNLPVAGPLAVFTNGPVHAPAIPEPLGGAILGLIGVAGLRRRA